MGGVGPPLTEMHGEITASIRMVFRNLQSEGQELHHPASIDVQKFAKFCREQQRRGMPQINEPKIAGRMHFTVQHGGSFPRILLLASSNGLAGGDGLWHSVGAVFKKAAT